MDQVHLGVRLGRVERSAPSGAGLHRILAQIGRAAKRTEAVNDGPPGNFALRNQAARL